MGEHLSPELAGDCLVGCPEQEQPDLSCDPAKHLRGHIGYQQRSQNETLLLLKAVCVMN